MTEEVSPKEERQMPYKLIGIIALCGLLETTYLTGAKYLQSEVACPATFTCQSVLNSSYAYFYNVPLSFFGMGAYAGLGALTIFAVNDRKAGRIDGEDSARNLMFIVGAAMALASSWFMYVMYFRLNDICLWCIASAVFSFASLAAMQWGMRENERINVANAQNALVFAFIAILSVYHTKFYKADPNEIVAGNLIKRIPYKQARILSPSPEGAVELAKRLNRLGAKFYGAFWCTHCREQKEIFGRDAVDFLPYVECYPDGYSSDNPNNTSKLCPDPDELGGFPAWVLGDQKILGEKQISQLSQIADEYEQKQLMKNKGAPLGFERVSE